MFAAALAGTLLLRRSMGGAMPVGEAMPMEPGPLGAAAAFLAMWVVMMVAMMMPSLVPMLSRYRRAAPGPAGAPVGVRTALVGAGYFTLWSVIGAAAYVAGLLWQAAERRWAGLAHATPLVAAAVLVGAGLVQLSGWKSRQLGRCRAAACVRAPGTGAWAAWRHGLEAGATCALCCSGFMTILVVAGVMDLRLMAAVAAAITVERLVPWPVAAARVAGILAVAGGGLALARALGGA
ncbi:MAG TPA: DUF2182 domain-containing protein [Gemmatimonadales bacterium]|nr:DUF2182 domain-containing protein [Gemmatimonadales bacterium]